MTDLKAFQDIHTGDNVTVRTKDGRIITGAVIQVQNNIIALQQGGSMVMVTADEIDTITMAEVRPSEQSVQPVPQQTYYQPFYPNNYAQPVTGAQGAQPMNGYPQPMNPYQPMGAFPQGGYAQPIMPQQDPSQPMGAFPQGGYAQPIMPQQDPSQPMGAFPQGGYAQPVMPQQDPSQPMGAFPQGGYAQPMNPYQPMGVYPQAGQPYPVPQGQWVMTPQGPMFMAMPVQTQQQYRQQAFVQPEQPAAPAANTIIDGFYKDIQPVEYTKAALEEKFNALEKDKKMLANSHFTKFRAKMSANEREGMLQAANDLISTLDNDDDYYEDESLNILAGMMYLAAGDPVKACASFNYVGMYDISARAAFAGELYPEAGAYAAVFLCECKANDERIGEQFSIVAKSALNCSDISGIRKIIAKKGREYMADGTDMITLSVSYIMGKIGGMTDRGTAANIEFLTSRLPEAKTVAIIDKLMSDGKSETSYTAQAVPAEPRKETITGVITANRSFAQSGTIMAGDAEYRFIYANIDDEELKNALKNGAPVPINIELELEPDRTNPSKLIPKHITGRGFYSKRPDRSAAAAILGETVPAASNPNYKPLFVQAKNLFTLGRHEEAKAIYEKLLDTPLSDEGVLGIVNCSLSLYNKTSDDKYIDSALDYADKYRSVIKNRMKASTIFAQVYTKCGQHGKAKALYQELLSLYPETRDYIDKRLDAIKCIIRADSRLGNYEEVKDGCTQWRRLFGEKPKTFFTNDHQLKNEIIPMLADAYYNLGDIDNAIKTARQASENPRAAELLSKISREAAERDAAESGEPIDDYLPIDEEETYSAPEAPEEAHDDSEDDFDYDELPEDENAQSLDELLEKYKDPDSFGSLGKTREEVCETAFSFGTGLEYCTLAYLHAAAHIDNSFRPLSRAASYAYDDPTAGYTYVSSDLAYMYDEVSRDFPDYADILYVPALLRAAFYSRAGMDYGLPSIISLAAPVINATAPAVAELIDLLMSLREKAGTGMDQFALRADNDAHTHISVDEIVKNACDYRDTKLANVVSSEGVERIRTTLQMEFIENSILRGWLDAVCNNAQERIPAVLSEIAEEFIKKGRECNSDNIDPGKMKEHIDEAWFNAGKRLKSKGKDTSMSSDLVSSRRNNIEMNIRRIIDFACSWAAAASAQDNTGMDVYLSARGDILAQLSTAALQCSVDNRLTALAYTIKELTARVEGKYDPSMKKYFYVDFLRGGEIMLDENYRPEYRSTFCGIKDFDILSRIERHAKAENPTLNEMVDKIISGEPTCGNFRALSLIKTYAEAKGITDITSRGEINHLVRYIAQTRNRTVLSKKSFIQELALSLSYGRLSNIGNKADMMKDCAEKWYDICTKTGDYGFFISLTRYINMMIEAEAKTHGEELIDQLSYLPDTDTSDPERQPAFTKQTIKEYIDDRNYRAAEDLMNRLTHNDTSMICDFTQEPLTFLKNFYDEYSNNYSIVSDPKVSLMHSIRRNRMQVYAPAKDLKGGEKLIESWIQNGNQPDVNKVIDILTTLGWSDFTVKQTNGTGGVEFRVKKNPTVGKQYYSHPIAAFSSDAEQTPFRVVCLFGEYNIDRLMDKFREINSEALHTIVLLDYSLQVAERRRLARKIKEEASFSRCFIVIDRVLLYYLAQHYSSNTINKRLMAVSFPFAYYQPFVPDSKSVTPPELFTGREAELATIEDVNGANLVYGGRQLGKSALLKQAKKNINNNLSGSRAVYVDIKDKGVERAAQAVSQELIDEGILSPDCLTQDWMELAHSIKLRTSPNYSGEGGVIPYLLLMIDEADVFFEDAKAIKYQPLTELKSILSANFKFVLAGLNNLIKYDRESSLSGNCGLIHFSAIKIGPFTASDATKLLTHTLAYLGLYIESQTTISLILATSNYFPGLIQLYCQKLLEAMKRPDYAGYHESDTPPYKVTDSHIKSVLEDESFTDEIRNKLEITYFIDRDEGGYNHVISLLVAHILNKSRSYRGCTIEEISAEAKALEISRVSTLNNTALKVLTDVLCALNVLRENDGYYNFASSAFREFLGSPQDIENSLLAYI